MTVREDDPAAPATVYCPVCWGAGRLFRVPPAADGSAPESCGCAKPSVEDMEAYPCTRCAGSGLVPTTSRPAERGSPADE